MILQLLVLLLVMCLIISNDVVILLAMLALLEFMLLMQKNTELKKLYSVCRCNAQQRKNGQVMSHTLGMSCLLKPHKRKIYIYVEIINYT